MTSPSTQNTMIIKNANGLTGCLIYVGNKQYKIRVYDEHKLGMFDDYDILISDLFFTINDEDATIYIDEKSKKKYIDHSPSTLGIKL